MIPTTKIQPTTTEQITTELITTTEQITTKPITTTEHITTTEPITTTVPIPQPQVPITTTEIPTTTQLPTTTQEFTTRKLPPTTSFITSPIDPCIDADLSEYLGQQDIPLPTKNIEIIEQMCTNLNVTTVTYNNQTVVINDLTSRLADYGCWCGKAFDAHGGNWLGGKPLDPLDRICQRYTECTKCERESGCKKFKGRNQAFNLTYTYSMDTECFGIQNITATKSVEIPSCVQIAVTCSFDFATEFMKLLFDQDFEINWFLFNLTNSDCVRGPIGKLGMIKDACCGTVPNWKSYNSNIHVCINETIYNL